MSSTNFAQTLMQWCESPQMLADLQGQVDAHFFAVSLRQLARDYLTQHQQLSEHAVRSADAITTLYEISGIRKGDTVGIRNSLGQLVYGEVAALHQSEAIAVRLIETNVYTLIPASAVVSIARRNNE